jgi:predicted 3-demethylubiquinone-9 3-methyltransferase (glyoxalase superfamily)
MAHMQKIVPNLWFDTEAEDAANFYTSVFKNSRVTSISHYGEAGPRPAGTVLTVEFELEGQAFTALNGGPDFKFDEAISLLINCESQEEVDYFWDELSAGGEEGPCGWLKDKYGVSWQVVPRRLIELTTGPDREAAARAFEAMLKMVKIDVAELERAARGEAVGAAR